ncbi:putative mitochondrial protein [Tanacetum coccineum]
MCICSLSYTPRDTESVMNHLGGGNSSKVGSFVRSLIGGGGSDVRIDWNEASFSSISTGYCMVLGIQWLSTLGDIKCNFGQLSLEFMWENKLVKLKGYQRKLLAFFYLEVLMGWELQPYSAHSKTVFGNSLKKNIIEDLVQEMLNNGMIRPSQSKFSSPVVLVKKQDGSSKKVDYLGYVISGEGVSADPSVFFQNYGKIAKPLTSLLKKGNFHWDLEATSAFQKLKEAMSHTLVLGLLNSEEPFIIETDASGVGLRAVLSNNRLYLASHSTWEKNNLMGVKKYYLEDDLLLRKGRLVVGDDKDLRRELIEFFHHSGLGGHSGVHATTQRLARTDY